MAELRANNQQLTSLGMVTPIIATIKNIIDDDKHKEKKIVVVDDSKFIDPNHYPIQNLDSIEDKDIDTTTEGSKDMMFSDSSSLLDRSTNTEEEEEDDKNRKF